MIDKDLKSLVLKAYGLEFNDINFLKLELE